jgi:hypothetical protein
MAGEPHPLQSILAFLDPLLAGAASVVKVNDAFRGIGAIGDDEAYPASLL